MKARSFIKIFKNNNYKETNLKTYRWLTKKLMYLSYNIKANTFFVMEQIYKYNTNPRANYLKVTKQIV